MLDVQNQPPGFTFGALIGALMAALTGIDNVSGPGMLDFESAQSLEKLVVDHEICHPRELNWLTRNALGFRQGLLDLTEELGPAKAHRIVTSYARRNPGFEVPQSVRRKRLPAFFRNLTVDVHLEDGRLAIDRVTAAGRGDGGGTGCTSDTNAGSLNSAWPSGISKVTAATSDTRLSSSFQYQTWSVLDSPLSRPNTCSKYSTWLAIASIM